MKQNDQHEFALYFPDLKEQKEIIFIDHDQVRRIGSVLRLKAGDSVMLFSWQQHALFTVQEITHKKVKGSLGQLQTNKKYEPHITLLLQSPESPSPFRGTFIERYPCVTLVISKVD